MIETACHKCEGVCAACPLSIIYNRKKLIEERQEKEWKWAGVLGFIGLLIIGLTIQLIQLL